MNQLLRRALSGIVILSYLMLGALFYLRASSFENIPPLAIKAIGILLVLRGLYRLYLLIKKGKNAYEAEDEV